MSWFARLFGVDTGSRDHRQAEPFVVMGLSDAHRRNASSMPRFNGLANEEVDGRRASHARQLVRRRLLARAFPLAQPISELRQFAGRRDLLETVIRSIEERRMHVVLYGDRGIGKTSLLNIVALLAQEARYLVRYSSCSATSEFDATFRAIAQDIPLLYHEKTDPTSARVEHGDTLADLLGPNKLTPASLSEMLEGVSGTRLLIILDEFDRTESTEFRREIAELIKNLSDRGSRVQVLIGGVAANLTELIRHIPSIRRNLLGIPVSKMGEAEICEVVGNGQSVSGLPISAEGLSRLIEAANGSPYLANLIAHEASSTAIDRNARQVEAPDIVAGISRSAHELTMRLDDQARAQVRVLLSSGERDDLRLAMRYSLDHFGHAPISMFPVLARLAAAHGQGVQGKGGEWVDDGEFRFVDDSVPLIVWLTLATEEQMLALERAS